MSRNPAQPCSMVAATDLSDADPTPGMTRQVATHAEGMWSGTVDTEPHAVSGWQHHGEYETTLFVVWRLMRLESVPGGALVVLAGAAHSLRVPAQAVHRESTSSD